MFLVTVYGSKFIDIFAFQCFHHPIVAMYIFNLLSMRLAESQKSSLFIC